MPEEFYDGVKEAFRDIWNDIIVEYCEQDNADDVIISLADVIKCLYLDKAPKTLEEISDIFQDLLMKREYHEYLHWFKWSAIECEEVKSTYHFCNPVDTSSARKWAESIILKYGTDYLHIKDFFNFGYLYGQFDWLNRLRFFLESPEEFEDDCY
jgi:hypothetical protein